MNTSAIERAMQISRAREASKRSRRKMGETGEHAGIGEHDATRNNRHNSVESDDAPFLESGAMDFEVREADHGYPEPGEFAVDGTLETPAAPTGEFPAYDQDPGDEHPGAARQSSPVDAGHHDAQTEPQNSDEADESINVDTAAAPEVARTLPEPPHRDPVEDVIYDYPQSYDEPYDRRRDVERIDIEKLGLENPKSPRMGDTRIAEEFRRIKRPLLRNAVNAPLEEMRNLILVTSSVPDEGKTFSALNLALSISLERDRTVLLVDCDLQRNQLTNMLGVSNHPGLTEYLSGQIVDIGDVMLPTLVSNINFIPSGATTRESAELMASDSMNSLTRELSARYRDRIIIFDSPPLLASNAASVLAHAVGQVVLVVEAEVTPQKVVVEGLSLIADHDLVGVLLNKRPLRSGFGYRHEYYGYY